MPQDAADQGEGQKDGQRGEVTRLIHTYNGAADGWSQECSNKLCGRGGKWAGLIRICWCYGFCWGPKSSGITLHTLFRSLKLYFCSFVWSFVFSLSWRVNNNSSPYYIQEKSYLKGLCVRWLTIIFLAVLLHVDFQFSFWCLAVRFTICKKKQSKTRISS